MASGVFSQAGQEAPSALESELHIKEDEERITKNGAQKLTIEDIRRRLKMVFASVSGVDASIDEAWQSALDCATEWKNNLDVQGSSPSPDRYNRMLEIRFGVNLAKKELQRKKADGYGHRKLFAGRTSADVPEIKVIDRKGNAVAVKSRQRWEFTKSLLRDVCDPKIPDEKLRKFTCGGKKRASGRQGFVEEYPGRNMMGKHYCPHSGRDEANRTRFDRESITMKHLDYAAPGTAPAFLGKGNEDGREIIFMEKAPGQTLDSMIDEISKLPDAQKYEIAAGLVRLVSAAINAGVVHRDLKGDNIMYDANDKIYTLLDLGLARFRHNDGTSDLPYNPTMTQMGDIVGNVRYIAPNQAQDSSKVDPRNDLYSLGLLVYEILTGIKGRIPPKNMEGEPDYARLLVDVRTPGFKEKLPLLYGSQRGEGGKIIRRLPDEGARAIEILIRRYEISFPAEECAAPVVSPYAPKNDAAETNAAANTYKRVAAAQAINETSEAPHQSDTVVYEASDEKDAGKQTIDFNLAANQKLETPEERAAWIEAKAMAGEALELLDAMAQGKGNSIVFHYRRKINLKLEGVIAIATKPWAVIAQILSLIMAVTGVTYYMTNRDPSREIVREAGDPDPDYFNISSIGYADGSEDLVMQMPSSTGIPPEQLKTGVHFWQEGANGQKLWIGGSTAIPLASRVVYFGPASSKLTNEASRIFHVKMNDAKFAWGSAGVRIFRPAAKNTKTSYATGQLPYDPKYPFVRKSQQQYGEWLSGMISDPEFQEFILSITLDGISVGNMDPRPFEDAGLDVLAKEKNLKIFTANLKSYQDTVKKWRALKLKEAENGKKISTLIPGQLNRQFADRVQFPLADSRQISAVQAKQYKERMNKA